MKLKEDQKKLKALLKETITLLCKSGLDYKTNFCIEALIGVTLDGSNGFFMTIKESFQNVMSKHNKALADFGISDSNIGESDLSETEEIGCQVKSVSKDISSKHSSSHRLKRKSCSSDNDDKCLQSSPNKQLKTEDNPSYGQHRSNSSEVFEARCSPNKHLKTEDLLSCGQPRSNSSDDFEARFSVQSEHCTLKKEPPDEDDDDDLILIKAENTNDFHDSSVSCSMQSNSDLSFSQQSENMFFSSSSAAVGVSSWSNTPPAGAVGTSTYDSTHDFTGTGSSQQINHTPNSQIYSNSSGGTSNALCICPLCAKPYRYKQGLKDHMRAVHSMGDPLKCICGESFLWRMTRDQHKKTCTAVLNSLN